MKPFVRGLRRLIAPVTRTGVFRRMAPRWLPPLERAIARLTGGRLQVSGILVPSLVLHTIGAKSGTERDTVLMYTPDGAGGAVVAGTSFARERHPAWTYNLLANPEVAVSVRGHRYPVRATLIDTKSGADRDAVWERIERQWPGYRGYERDSGRTVRLFRLAVTDSASGVFPVE